MGTHLNSLSLALIVILANSQPFSLLNDEIVKAIF
jgi:hypothetical protein